MRKLKLQLQISIDGYIAGTEGEMDWMEWNWSDDIEKYVAKLTDPVETIVLGRKQAEGFIPYWADAVNNKEIKGAEKMHETPKVVFTHTLENNPWQKAVLAKGSLVDEINNLKNTGSGDIIAYGGAEFASSLIKAGVIDDYYLFVNPTAIGRGMPVFEEITKKLSLKLNEAKAFKCGVAILHYKK